jgi:hypothetical protein
MTDRITTARVEAALDRLATVLVDCGVCTPDQVAGIQLAQPYGLAYHVVRYVPNGRPGMPLHDVPGFDGFSCGYDTRRAAYDAIRQTATAIYQAMDPRMIQRRADMFADHMAHAEQQRAGELVR